MFFCLQIYYHKGYIKHDIYYILQCINRQKLSINFLQKINIKISLCVFLGANNCIKNKNHLKKVVFQKNNNNLEVLISNQNDLNASLLTKY